MTTFFVIESTYVGPNTDQHIDYDRIVISTEPARANMSHEPRTEGWCGTTNDISEAAYGAYETIEAARAVIEATWGDEGLRSVDGPHGDPEIVEVYKAGRYEPLCRDASWDWIYPDVTDDVTADTTDEQIGALLSEYETAANEQGYTLTGDLETWMRDRRDNLRAEKEA